MLRHVRYAWFPVLETCFSLHAWFPLLCWDMFLILFSQNSLCLIQVGAVAVFVTRHRQLVGGGKEELQHIVRVIVLNMVCTSLPLSILNGLNFCILFSEIKRYRGIKQWFSWNISISSKPIEASPLGCQNSLWMSQGPRLSHDSSSHCSTQKCM